MESSKPPGSGRPFYAGGSHELMVDPILLGDVKYTHTVQQNFQRNTTGEPGYSCGPLPVVSQQNHLWNYNILFDH